MPAYYHLPDKKLSILHPLCNYNDNLKRKKYYPHFTGEEIGLGKIKYFVTGHMSVRARIQVQVYLSPKPMVLINILYDFLRALLRKS